MLRSEFRKTILDNGVTLVAERYRHMLSVSIGVWVRVGSSFESPDQSGMSHFLEHMVFKGTKNKSALEIATVLEALGGELNGFTDKEYTCYHATILKHHVDVALETLSDLIINPIFPPAEVDREKKILLQELAMVEDSPEESITDTFLKNVWKGELLGQPVIGTKKSIRTIKRGQMLKFFKEHYRPENIVISVAGNVDFDFLKERCKHFFQFKPSKKTLPVKWTPSRYRPRRRHVMANTEHVHLLVGFEAGGFKDTQRFELLILSFFLGGGMSSRLFQEIREKAALAYTVECDYIPFAGGGVFDFYVATSINSLTKCLKILGKEVERLKTIPLTDKELDLVKGQLNGAILLASDEMESRQESLGRNEIIFGRHFAVREVIDEIEKVNAPKVQELAKRIFVPEKESIFTLGRFKPRRKRLSIF